MASDTYTQPGPEIIHQPLILQAIIGAAVLGLAYFLLTGDRPYAGIPIIKREGPGLLSWLPAKYAFMLDAPALFAKGRQETTSCFQLAAAGGYKVVVPNRFVEELKNHPDLSFTKANAHDFFVKYPGFEGFDSDRMSNILTEMIKKRLTSSSDLVTQGLIEETNDSCHDNLGEVNEWMTITLRQQVCDTVARLSARVFLGKEYAHNPEWIRISKEYAINGFVSRTILHLFPKPLQPIAAWFLPTTRKLRAGSRRARQMMEPEVERRQPELAQAQLAGRKPQFDDSIGWMLETAQGRPVDYAAGQLSLSLASIHTTTEMLSQAIIQVCDTPDIVQPVREEIVTILREVGWGRTTLSRMKLLDSFLKEVLRTRGTPATMTRMCTKPVTLSDGTRLPQGALLMMLNDKTMDPSTYESPEKFDAYRYLRLRSREGEENRHQFTSTSADNLGFSYGVHACPGRFFAANELKIALCFFLLKYDVRFVPGESRPKMMCFEQHLTIPPSVKVQIRRRQEEINPLSPKEE
ncbi:hypothetical protein DOTSEDRAFT_74878 [Dothistroma septosporum NZE10]|uniref:Uncharacterized protein n=1 Tax=Dothistroma septosporum (strain NZE10 / CBS 128990) TaxID=675120 RepID=N1PF71_DOTSN|nr:hypothetical protein DOTSEDRAFT_74878 [Dothistroma septosporum NZE10]